jgi:hypothetical protein
MVAAPNMKGTNMVKLLKEFSRDLMCLVWRPWDSLAPPCISPRLSWAAFSPTTIIVGPLLVIPALCSLSVAAKTAFDTSRSVTSPCIDPNLWNRPSGTCGNCDLPLLSFHIHHPTLLVSSNIFASPLILIVTRTASGRRNPFEYKHCDKSAIPIVFCRSNPTCASALSF